MNEAVEFISKTFILLIKSNIFYTTLSGIIVGIIVGIITFRWSHYKKMKAEIEDSRIDWIQHVRKINVKLIDSYFSYLSAQQEYLGITKKIKSLEEKLQNLIEGVNWESKKSEPNTSGYKIQIEDTLIDLKTVNANLKQHEFKKTQEYYAVLSVIEEMKNLFPTERYIISKATDKNGRKFLKASLITDKENKDNTKNEKNTDQSVSNTKLYDELNTLKNKTICNYKSILNIHKECLNCKKNQGCKMDENTIDSYILLINRYLKIEWEKVKFRKS